MSFARAQSGGGGGSPSTAVRTGSASARLSSSSRTAHPSHTLEQKENTEETAAASATATSSASEAVWSEKLWGHRSRSPPRSKWSIDTSAAGLAALASAREEATLRSSLGGLGGTGAAIDRSYSAAHAAHPVSSSRGGGRGARPASWEAPLHDAHLSLHRLALAGVERPDLAKDFQLHVDQQRRADEIREKRERVQKFLFREARLGALHRRKRERVELEQRAALRPVPPPSGDGTAEQDGSRADTAPSAAADPAAFVNTVDTPQFSPLSVAPPLRPDWNAAHHLSRDLSRHPWRTSPERAVRAVEAIERKAFLEASQAREERSEASRRIQAVRDAEARLRQANQRRDALIHEQLFRAGERVPQNLDAHLKYLVSHRCAPRPPQARPPSTSNAETFRQLLAPPPHHRTAAHHTAHAGWTSLRSKITYPSASVPNSGRSTHARPRPPSEQQVQRGSTRRQSRHDDIFIAAAASGGSPETMVSFSPRQTPSSLSHAPPGAYQPILAVSAAEKQILAGADEESGLTSLALAMNATAAAASAAAPLSSAAQAQAQQFKVNFAAAVSAHEAEQAEQAQAAQQQQHSSLPPSAWSSRPASSPCSSTGGVAASSVRGSLRADGVALVSSPRSNGRLGMLWSPASPPLASPRLEALAKPLRRIQTIRPVDRTHRDFRGLELGAEQARGGGEEEAKEQQQQQQAAAAVASSPPAPLSSSGPSSRPRSALSSRPSTARSRFVRDSRSAASPQAPLYDESNWTLPAAATAEAVAALQRQKRLTAEQEAEAEAAAAGDGEAAGAAAPPLPLRPGSFVPSSARAQTARSYSSSSSSSSARRHEQDPPQPSSQFFLQHPADHDPVPMWRRENRFQHVLGSL